MYEHFSDRAQKVMRLAEQEARQFNHEHVGTEHVLLGLLHEGSGVAANVLKNLDIDLVRIRLEVEKLVQVGTHPVAADNLPLTPRAENVIVCARGESRVFNHNYVGTEHLLLGLLHEKQGVAALALANFGVELKDVRNGVLSLLGPATSEAPHRMGAFGIRQSRVAVIEPPAACPQCGQSHIVCVLWNWVHLWGQKEEDVRSGKAILGPRYGAKGPWWVCLDCSPGWSEVHRLAMQEWQWQLAKEEAVAAKDFEKATWYRDLQDELGRRLSSVVDELSKSQ